MRLSSIRRSHGDTTSSQLSWPIPVWFLVVWFHQGQSDRLQWFTIITWCHSEFHVLGQQRRVQKKRLKNGSKGCSYALIMKVIILNIWLNKQLIKLVLYFLWYPCYVLLTTKWKQQWMKEKEKMREKRRKNHVSLVFCIVATRWTSPKESFWWSCIKIILVG